MTAAIPRKRTKENFREFLYRTFTTAFSIGLIFMLVLTFFMMKIGEWENAERERQLGIKVKTYNPQEEKVSVKEQVDAYIDTLPTPPRTYVSIHQENILMARAQEEEEARWLEEAMSRNPNVSRRVQGITPTVRVMNTSAYCPCVECCGKDDGITATGTKAIEWYTVAAGERYQFGTVVYIPSLNDKPNGGWFVVEDRGGAISSDKLDIYFDSHLAAKEYGRRNQECYIFEY